MDVRGTAQQIREYDGPALFSFGFRPFFFAGSLWAALATPLWVLSLQGLLPVGPADRDWHVHEMIFGYLPAVIAGFLLTAVPNWTGRLPVTGTPLICLFALWLAGRLAMLNQSILGPMVAVIDCAFLVTLALAVWREVLIGRNVRNVPICALIAILALANIAFHLDIAWPAGARLGERAAVAAVSMLMALIGGRVTPSFTRNWMVKRALKPEPRATDRFDAIALILTAFALCAWLVAPLSSFAGYALMIAGVALFGRLARWSGWVTFREPLVLILHIAYLWLSISFVLLGLSGLVPAIPGSACIHALTTGAFGAMTLAVMTRASRGHIGRPLTADGWTQAIYLAVNLGAAARVCAGFFPAAYQPLLAVSSLLWSGAFLLFALVYGPMLTARRAQTAIH